MAGKRMTMDDLVRMNSAVIPGTWAAQVMGMNPTRLVGYARDRPDLLQFPFQLSGNHVKIPRVPFLKWLGVTDEQIERKSLR
jgi:hypothetical protein